MNRVNESFSAFLDGEASELDIQRMLKAMDEDPSVAGEFHNLSKVQATLQSDVVVNAGLEFADVPVQTEAKKSTVGFRLFQGGIAAAVAMVVVTTVNLTANSSVTPEIAEATVAPVVENVNLAQQQFEAQQRLDMFLREHAEQASFTTGHVVIPSDLEWVEGVE